MSLHVAVDLDDVTLEFAKSVFASVELEFGEKYPFDGDPWGPDAVALREHPMWKDIGYDDWWGWLAERDWLWATFPAVPGAIGGIKRLRHAGHYVECVTSKPAWAEFAVWKWLGRWRPAFNRVTIVDVSESKLDHTDAHIIVDDKSATVVEFHAYGRGGILFDRTYHQTIRTSPTTWKVNGWTDIPGIIDIAAAEGVVT